MNANSQPEPHLCELLSLFPYDLARPVQVAALGVIARMFNEDRRFTIIEAPTGAGKSALALTTALYAATLKCDGFEPGAYILTPYNNLVTQMEGSFSNTGLTALRGKKHYEQKAANSSYEVAKADFAVSALGVTNYAYFLRAHHLRERQVLILDEAHNLENILVDMAGFRITPQICRTVGVDMPLFQPHKAGAIVDWLGSVLSEALLEQLNRCEDLDQQREWQDLAARVAGYTELDDRSRWIAWTDEGSLIAKPLSVTDQARGLFARAKHVLIQSATVFDFATFRRVLGIPDTAETFCAPSDFPMHNRPIIFRPVGDMAFRTMDESIPKLCAEVERIVSDFGQYKGVIHTHSYYINQRVSRHLINRFGNRIITHGRNPLDRAEAIRLHFATKGWSVLVSPSLTEGVDLKDELARYQIVCKIPYPRLDAYTRARSARDNRWYELKTAWALVQMVGRAVRSDTDFAATFVLDSHFEKFASRNERILPAWWRSAIRTSARAA
jgi:Rad3-related DNA helicase